MKDQTTYDFIDESQAPNYNPPSTLSTSSSKKISIVDFINSNDGANPTFYSLADTSNQALSDNNVNTKTFVMNNVQNTKVSIADFIAQSANSVDPEYYSGYFSKDKQKTMNLSVTNVPYPRFS